MKNAINRYFDLNPLLVFFPFLLLFILIILNFGSNKIIGDEVRYFNFANNILAGFYSPPSPDINLWNGPGYPLFLTPFVWLQTPLIILKLTNAFLQYFSIIFAIDGLILHHLTIHDLFRLAEKMRIQRGFIFLFRHYIYIINI